MILATVDTGHYLWSVLVENRPRLTKEMTVITIVAFNGVLNRGDTLCRTCHPGNRSSRDIAHTAGNMVSLGWLMHITGKRADSFNWKVNPDVHELFKARAQKVRNSNAEMAQSIEEAKANARAKAEAEEAQLEADDIPPHMLN